MSERPDNHQLERLRAIIEGTRAGTWEWNAHTGELVINDRWAQMLGYTQAELEPISIANWKRLCHPDDFARSSELLARHFKGDVPITIASVACAIKRGSGYGFTIVAS